METLGLQCQENKIKTIEGKSKEIEERLKVAEEALKFYAERYSWEYFGIFDDGDVTVSEFSIMKRKDISMVGIDQYGGKRAREYFKKWGVG